MSNRIQAINTKNKLGDEAQRARYWKRQAVIFAVLFLVAIIAFIVTQSSVQLIICEGIELFIIFVMNYLTVERGVSKKVFMVLMVASVVALVLILGPLQGQVTFTEPRFLTIPLYWWLLWLGTATAGPLLTLAINFARTKYES